MKPLTFLDEPHAGESPMIEQNTSGQVSALHNATEIMPGVFLGSMTDARNFKGTRLCVRDEGVDYEGDFTHIPMLIPVPEGHAAPYCISQEALHKAAIFVKHCVYESKPILVHCMFGRDRSPLVVAYWLVLMGLDKSFEEAYQRIQALRPCVVDRTNWVERGLSLEAGSGCAGWVGHPPVVKQEKSEQAKYIEMWGKEEYRQVAPGELCATEFMEIVRPKQGAEVLDFGAGTGRGALMLALLGGCKVKMLDFAPNCLDEDVRNALTTQAHVLSFAECNLVKPIPHHSEYGYCTDVMEHIPPEWVTTVLVNILHAAQHVFFQISCEEDQCGKLIGESLHLTVQPYAWWVDRLQKLGAKIHWSRDHKTHCLIYCSAWIEGRTMVDEGGTLNTTEEEIRKNVEINLQADWTDIGPHETNDKEIIILGGGPSLSNYADEIEQLKRSGVSIVTLNGAYHWARKRGLWPVNQFVVDAREFNERFTHPVDERNLYFIASQCHPRVLEGLPKDRTFLFHTAVNSIRDLLDKHRGLWFDASGGSTVFLRAITVLTMMGFRKFHVYGVDSCLIGLGHTGQGDTELLEMSKHPAQHHAYEQKENDNAPVIPVIVKGKTFYCQPWMVSQAQEFMDLIRIYGNVIELNVRGDGLLAWILECGAKESDEAIMSLA